MSTLKLYNTLSRAKDDFIPIDDEHVKLYACGPTVYSYAHIGNARASIVFDTLRRVLETKYPMVTYVANLTDIDDKIIAAAQIENKPISEITEHYATIYNNDMAALGVQKPTIQPKATDHVDGMIAMIVTLIEKGHAYTAEGHVLFHVPSYNNYGALSGRPRDEQVAMARIETATYKRDPADFVLWKPSTDDQPGWNSPWGRGRPGWHIECSVMAREFLGEVFDIHGGGLDLTFPHHENEIAQSCCATGQSKFANYWVHNGFVTVEGEKMSKSLGNVLLSHDLIADGIKGEAIRLNLLSTHYRQPFDWTNEGLNQANKTLDKWYDVVSNIDQSNNIDAEFLSALYDDMNTPLAFAILHKLAKANSSQLRASANILGLLYDDPKNWLTAKDNEISQEKRALIETLIAKRNQARTDKDFKKSDDIRDELLSMGIELKDSPNGTTWHSL